ncbi:MAG: hypothetical protein KKA78_05280, partial [Alphaproteobacteria bacterium]|nr:hypothetical protein [Alphaproteobacteria bacterium]
MTTDPSTSHVCLVADTVTQHDASFANRTLEFTEATYLKAVVGGLTDAGFRVTHLDSPGALAAQAPALLREDAVVISLWSGTRTRTRRTLVPSTCEGLGLRYVGADAYSAIVCQDKDLAKSYAWRHGIAGPAGQYLLAPFVDTPWADWRGFWLGQILDDRFVVVWFLPLLPIL